MCIDECLGRVADAIERVEAADPDGPGAALLITADHGNADQLKDADGKPVTAHSLNPVPFLAMGRALTGSGAAQSWQSAPAVPASPSGISFSTNAPNRACASVRVCSDCAAVICCS